MKWDGSEPLWKCLAINWRTGASREAYGNKSRVHFQNTLRRWGADDGWRFYWIS